RTNRSGGVQGGISNGMPILVRVAFKPTATIMKPQRTVTADGKPAVLKGRQVAGFDGFIKLEQA
ncbi:MAG: chorismate synthase, partial [Planctomycetota bacterium]|nr:chorismate synthase [Planctomycetota bacterium]